MSAPKLTVEQDALNYGYDFRCAMCGDRVDEDYQYCRSCGDHSGDWILCKDEGEGEEVENG